MYKKILLITFILLLAVSAVKAQSIGDSCLNNADCNSNICQGGECISSDIRDLFTPDDDDDDEYDNGGYCLENWQCTNPTACINNQQTRTCTDLNDCQNDLEINIKPNEIISCTPLALPTCFDSIKNQGEEGVDCGGPCAVCADCYDSQQNCHSGSCEDGVDCGGPCMPCKRAITAMLIIITAVIVVILLILGFWYFKIKGTGKVIGQTAKQFGPPPIQPSSRLKI